MEANEAMKAMARRIADELIPDPENESVVYKSFHRTAERAALAAIMETQARDAELVEKCEPAGVGIESVDEHIAAVVDDLATAIRAGEHYALAGDRHG